MTTVDITIGVPVYKTTAEQIQPLLRSLDLQQLTSYEIIFLLDGLDGLSEDLLCIIENVKNARVIRQEHAGEAVARNRIIIEARGEWLVFCDADDYVLKGGIKSLYSYAIEHNSDVVFSNHIRVYGNKCKRIEYFKNNVANSMEDSIRAILSLGTDQGTVWGKIFKLSFIKDNDLYFNPSLKNGVDQEFMTRVIAANPAATAVNAYTYAYVYNVNSVVRKFDDKYAERVNQTINIISSNLNVNFKQSIPSYFLIYLYDRFLLILVNYICAGKNVSYREMKDRFLRVRDMPFFSILFEHSLKHVNVIHYCIFSCARRRFFFFLLIAVKFRNFMRFS